MQVFYEFFLDFKVQHTCILYFKVQTQKLILCNPPGIVLSKTKPINPPINIPDDMYTKMMSFMGS